MKKILYIAVTFLLISCGKNTTETATVNESENSQDIKISKAQFESNGMALGTAKITNFNEYISANGHIDVPPQNKVSVRTFMEGYVKKSPFLIGNKVEKGQLLLTLENPEYVSLQQDYMEVGHQLEYLEAEYHRQETLYKEEIASQKSYLKAKSEYNASMAAFKGLEKKIRMLNLNPEKVMQGDFSSEITLYAPINGTIANLNFTLGSYVSPTDELMEIVNNDHIHLELEVFEKDILEVHDEQPILFKVLEASSKEFKASVHLVGNTISSNKTVKVHAHLENEKEMNFTVGMYVNAQIITNTKEAYAIGAEAVQTEDDKQFVFVLSKETATDYYFKKTALPTLEKNEQYVAVPEKYKSTKVLISGAHLL